MPKNQFSVWSEIVDHRDEKLQEKYELTNHDIEIIQRIFQGDKSKGINLHKLKGTTPPVYSAYVNDTRRLLFIAKGSTLALVDITEHKYDTTHSLQPGVAERFYQKPWDEIKDNRIEYEEITDIPNFTPNPNYVYEKPEKCVSYHKKFITLDENQENALTLETTPCIILGDPGCGKTTLCSEGLEADLKNPDLLADGKHIVYFSQSGELPRKIQQAWVLDHPVAARQPEAEQLLFMNYTELLKRFGPADLQGKKAVDKPEFEAHIKQRLSNKNLLEKNPFLKTPEFKKLRPTLYHEFQILAVCEKREDYISGKMNANFPKEMRAWVYDEYLRYTKKLCAEETYDTNLFLWQPENQPFSRVYHDEALSASPAINHMLRLLTKQENIIYFCDPNQQNTDQKSNLNGIQNGFGVNPNPIPIIKLPITYRLPPTIADVANALLIMKQNINNGKNEKNQSDQVVCKADEHAAPGHLTWVSLEDAKPFVHTLNESNHVYVVITYPEYLEDAKKLFGDRVYVCTIDEARGQEFEEAVFYRVTDPAGNSLKQVCKILAPLDEDLKSKPNLPKADKENHAFEVYMNNIYIALSRVTRHGYFMEAGNPSKNEFHRRLNQAINKAMQGVASEKQETPANLDDILAKARQDLAEGNTGQAKAGFLKAGKTEAEFENEKAALEAKNKALAEKIRNARNAASITKPEAPSPSPSTSTQSRRNTPPKQSQPTESSAPAKQSPAPVVTLHRSHYTNTVLSHFDTLENAKKTMTIQDDGIVYLLKILETPALKRELFRILDDKTDNTAKRAQITFKIALQNISLADILPVIGNDEQPYHLPFLHYLMSNHLDLMLRYRGLHNAQLVAQVESAVFETNYWSDALQVSLNLITLIGQTDEALLAILLRRRPNLVGHINWAWLYRNTPMEAFFKENQTSGQMPFTPKEAMEKLSVDKMTQEKSMKLLSEQLRDRSTYPLYATNHTTSGNNTLLTHFFILDEFRHEFLRAFEEITESGRYDDFLYFIQYNNINQLVHFIAPAPLNKVISIPLIHFLCQTNVGKTIIRHVLESEPRQLVKAISLASLTEAVPLIADPNITTSLLQLLAANNAIDIFSKICEYSDVLENASPEYFQQAVEIKSGKANLFGCLIAPLFIKPLDGPRCIQNITALCHMFEAATNAQPLSTDNSLLQDVNDEYHFFVSLKKVIPPALTNRFLFLLGVNTLLLKTITMKYQLPKVTPAPELQQRRIKLSGLLPDEIQRYERMLKKNDIRALNQLFDEPNAACFLMQSLGASRPRPLFIYLLENERLKHGFLTMVSRRLKANPHDPIGALFTKPALSMLVTVQSHAVPVLFELMQSDLGFGIVEALEKAQPDFYARIQPPIFTCVYYSRQYQTKVSLLFLASHQRQASCFRMLSQNNAVKQNLSSLSFVHAYVLPDGTSQSILSNLLLTIKTNKDEQITAIYDVICHRNHHIYRVTSANDWLAKNHTLEPQGPKISLLDLMLTNLGTLGILCSLMVHYSHNIAEQEDLEAYISDFTAYVNSPNATLNSEMKLGLLYLLNQEDTPTRLMRLMPNGQTLLSTLLLNETFCYVLNTSLSARAFTDDAEDRYVDFFNHIGVETSVITVPGERKPLLLILMEKRFSNIVINALYENKNSRYYLKKNTLTDWLNPVYQFPPEDERSRCSHLDLMLSNDRLVGTAKKIIETHLEDFIKNNCNDAYLLYPVFIHDGWTNRMTLLLKQNALHGIALTVLKRCPLPAKTLADLLSLPTSAEEKQGLNLFTHLEQSGSGRQLLEFFSAVKGIGKFLSPEIGARCVNYLPSVRRAGVSVTQHGMFPPVTPEVRVVETAEEGMNILNSMVNIRSKK